MRLLLIGGDEAEMSRTGVAVRGAGHEAWTVRDLRGGLSVIGDKAVDVVVISLGEVTPTALQVVQLAREYAPLERAQILVMSDGLPEDLAARAYSSGLDGEMPRRVGMPYILARISALQRLQRTTGRKDRYDVAGATNTPTTVLGGPLDGIARSTAWRIAADTIVEAVGKFMSLQATARPLTDATPPAEIARAIMLSNVVAQAEIRLAVGADMRSAHMLATHLFGEADDGLVADMLGEIANLAMGTLKSSFSIESIPFTGGLPEAIPPESVAKTPGAYKFYEQFALQVADATVTLHLGLRPKANLFLTPDRLRENMVVATDVFNGRGMILVGGGTRLSANMVERLRTMLPPRQQIEVMA